MFSIVSVFFLLSKYSFSLKLVFSYNCLIYLSSFFCSWDIWFFKIRLSSWNIFWLFFVEEKFLSKLSFNVSENSSLFSSPIKYSNFPNDLSNQQVIYSTICLLWIFVIFLASLITDCSSFGFVNLDILIA